MSVGTTDQNVVLEKLRNAAYYWGISLKHFYSALKAAKCPECSHVPVYEKVGEERQFILCCHSLEIVNQAVMEAESNLGLVVDPKVISHPSIRGIRCVLETKD
jgi:hypothetical protein